MPTDNQSCLVWFDQDIQAVGDPKNVLMLAGRPGVARGFLISIEMQSLSPFKKNYKPCANFWKFDSLVTWIVLFKSLLVNNLVWSDQDKQAEGDHDNILMLAGRPGVARVFFISIEMQSTNEV